MWTLKKRVVDDSDAKLRHLSEVEKFQRTFHDDFVDELHKQTLCLYDNDDHESWDRKF